MDDQYRGSDDIPFEWDQRLIKTASDAAAYHTRRISQRRGLNPSDRDDLRQDILLALLTRAHRYDQLRGATATFVKVLTRHAVVDQARAARTSSRLIDAEARRVCRNVKHWRDAAMALRWTGAAMLEAAKGFRRLKAHRQLPILKAALAAHGARHTIKPVLERQSAAA